MQFCIPFFIFGVIFVGQYGTIVIRKECHGIIVPLLAGRDCANTKQEFK